MSGTIKHNSRSQRRTRSGNYAGFSLRIAALCSFVLLASCKSVTTTPTVVTDSGQRWALLPIENLSSTPLAGERVANLVETQLRKRGVTLLNSYSDSADSSGADLATLLDSGVEIEKARQWARSGGYRYAMTGTVNEWHYKNGTDKEPAVGLNLKLIDLPTGIVIWQGTGSRTGWGYSNLARIGEKVANDLVSELSIKRQSVPLAAARAAIPAPSALNVPSIQTPTVNVGSGPAVDTVEQAINASPASVISNESDDIPVDEYAPDHLVIDPVQPDHLIIDPIPYPAQ